MAHDHAHAPPKDIGPAFRWAVGLNVGYVIVEATAGFLTGSLALLADAAHNLTDVAGLLVAWGAAVLAKRAGTQAHTWGLGRATIMAAMFNAIAIIVGVGAVIWEASRRFGAVVVAAIAIILTGKTWLDPAVAIAVSLLIAVTAAGLLREALHLSLDGVPEGIDRKAVADWLRAQPGVEDVHDLHIWALSTTRTALAVHVVWCGGDGDALLRQLAHELAEDFGIAHATIQLETCACDSAFVCLPGQTDAPQATGLAETRTSPTS
ncbi:MAG: cation transporter [Rhodobacterales bacterium]|nr:cation transporter [Rhodobacterales bacterium]